MAGAPISTAPSRWSAVEGFPDVAAVLKSHRSRTGEGYPLSKELLLLWTQLAAHQELFKSRGIRVVSVSPGPVETPILGQFREVFGDAARRQRHRGGRPGRHAGGHRAGGGVPLLGWRALDQWRLTSPADGGLEAAVNAEVLGF